MRTTTTPQVDGKGCHLADEVAPPPHLHLSQLLGLRKEERMNEEGREGREGEGSTILKLGVGNESRMK